MADENPTHSTEGAPPPRNKGGRPKGSKNRRYRRRTRMEIQEMGAGYTAEALGTIIRALRADDCGWPDKLRAAFGLLDHVYGKPAQQVRVDMRSTVTHTVIKSDAELREALIAKGCHPLLLPPPFVDNALAQIADDPGAPVEAPEDHGRPDQAP